MPVGLSEQRICALSTPRGRSALALIRVSGPNCRQLAEAMGAKGLVARQPKLANLRSMRGEPLDEAVITYLEHPATYTGEDMLEISCHGNPLVFDEIIKDLVSRETRLAEPGEFTRRALANQKLTLDQVEALDKILNSTQIGGVRLALKLKLEGLQRFSGKLRGRLLDLLVGVQAQLDFSEAEVGDLSASEICKRLDGAVEELESWTRAYQSNRRLLQKWSVSIVGPPNAGKSSLFNALVGSPKAIVYDQPGTTRDFLEAEVDFGGVSLVVVDTAGLRGDPDPVERLGIERSYRVMDISDLILWVSDLEGPSKSLVARYSHKKWLLVQSKADLAQPIPAWASMAISSKTGSGLEALRLAIQPPVESQEAGQDVPGLITERQELLCKNAALSLKRAKTALSSGVYLDQVCQDILLACHSLDELTGGAPNEAVISEIFSRFCIGK